MSSTETNETEPAAAAAATATDASATTSTSNTTTTTPKLVQSHMGEHHGDHGDIMQVPINSKQRLFAFCAAINSCNLGYDIGVNTQAGPLVQEAMNLSDVQLEIFFGSINLFAMIGALSAHWISDTYGRRRSFLVAAIVFCLGIIVLVMAQNFVTLMIGRVFVGLGVGFGLAIDPLYISEMTPASHRGELVTWSEIAINVGIVLGFASGFLFAWANDVHEWRWMFGLGGVLPIVMIYLATNIMPESPRWLVSKGNTEEAKRILTLVYPDGYDVDPVITDMQESLEREQAAGRAIGWDMVFFPTPAIRRMLLVGWAMAVAAQAVGVDAIQYFLLFIIEETGITSKPAQSGILIVLGLIKMSTIVIGGRMFDRRGRRPLLFISLIGMTIALLVLSLNFLLSLSTGGGGTLAIVALALYLCFFSVGIGPGAWVISSEVFATCIRAKAMSVATFLNRAVATLMTSTFLSTADAMTWSAFFFMLAMICIIILVFVYFLVPETKGRSLEDMSVYFAELTGDRSMLEAEARLVREREARERQQEQEEGTGGRNASEPPAATAGTMT